MTVGSLVVGAFFIGRHTALPPASSTPPADPCAEVFAAYRSLEGNQNWDEPFKVRAYSHLVVDHPQCFDTETVVMAKTNLDRPLPP